MKNEPVVFLHGINMTAYNGHESNIYAGGFKYAKKHGHGGEMYNFKNIGDRYYGHVEIMPRKIKGHLTDISIRLEKLGALKTAASLDGVLVVWTAPCRDGNGSEVVGWYRNATLHRHRVYPTGELKKARKFKNPRTSKTDFLDYRVEAKVGDCRLLHPDERVLKIPSYPKSVKGVPGQSSVYYPFSQSTPEAKKLRDRVLAFINEGVVVPMKKRPRPMQVAGRQLDLQRRKKIENAAVKFVSDHFGRLGYAIESREKDNVGYDLLTTKGDVMLCVEVKGRSISNVVADFSPNESRAIKAHQDGKFKDGEYRVCIVTDALNESKRQHLHHFSWWRGVKKWIKVDGSEVLNFRPSGATRGALDSEEPDKDDEL